jgi:hypothetical protein
VPRFYKPKLQEDAARGQVDYAGNTKSSAGLTAAEKSDSLTVPLCPS